MNQIAEGIVFWGALLTGLVVYVLVGRRLMRQVQLGKSGRFAAVVVYGAATPLGAMVPLLIAYMARWIGNLVGFRILVKEGPDDGVMVGIGIMGMLVAMGAVALFAAIMVFQAMTGSGGPDSDVQD